MQRAASSSSSSGNVVKEEKFRMKKKLGFWSGTALICGLMIGSGIFASPVGIINGMNGSIGLSLIIWVVCGILSGISALCYAELGCCIKESGGGYAYHNAAIGPVAAFIYAWTKLVVIRPTASVAAAMVFGKYVLQPFFPGCSPPMISVKLIAAFFIIAITWINCRSVKAVAKIQIVFTAAKFLVLTVIIVAGVVWLIQDQEIASEQFGNSFDPDITSEVTVREFVLTFFQCSFSYSGFNALNSVTEEMRDVKKNLTKAIVFSVIAVTCFYVMVNVAYFCVLGKEDLLSSNVLAVTFAKKALGPLKWIVPIGVCISIFGSSNAGKLSATRATFVAARHEQMPDILSMIHTEYYTPTPSIVFGSIIALCMLCISDSVMYLLSAFGFSDWLFHGLVALDLLILRHRRPQLDRPFRIPLILPILIVILSVAVIVLPLIYVHDFQFLYAVAFMLAGLPVYYLFVYKQFSIPRMRPMTTFLQKLMNVAPTEWEHNT